MFCRDRLRRGHGGAVRDARARKRCVQLFRLCCAAQEDESRRPGSLIWRRPPGLRCAAPWQAFSHDLYAPATRALSSASGRHGCPAPLSLQPTGSTTAAAVACRYASVDAVITATSIAPGRARRFAAASRCVAPRHAISERAAERIDMPFDNVAGALAIRTQ